MGRSSIFIRSSYIVGKNKLNFRYTTSPSDDPKACQNSLDKSFHFMKTVHLPSSLLLLSLTSQPKC